MEIAENFGKAWQKSLHEVRYRRLKETTVSDKFSELSQIVLNELRFGKQCLCTPLQKYVCVGFERLLRYLWEQNCVSDISKIHSKLFWKSFLKIPKVLKRFGDFFAAMLNVGFWGKTYGNKRSSFKVSAKFWTTELGSCPSSKHFLSRKISINSKKSFGKIL